MAKKQTPQEIKKKLYESLNTEEFQKKAELSGFEYKLLGIDNDSEYFHIHLERDDVLITSQCSNGYYEPYGVEVRIDDNFSLPIEWEQLKRIILDFDTFMGNVNIYKNQINALRQLGDYIKTAKQDLENIILYRALSTGDHRAVLNKYRAVLKETEDILIQSQ